MEIVGLGLTVVDLMVIVETFPQIDSKQEAQQSLVQVGGPVPTALAQLTRFGWTCRHLSAWGDDPLGRVIEHNLKETGISHPESCRQSDAKTGFSQVWVERSNGQRTTVTQRPIITEVLSKVDLVKELTECEVLHLDGWPTRDALIAARTVKARGGRVFVDTGSPKPGIEELLSLADYVNAPRRFVEELLQVTDSERGAVAIAAMGPSSVTVTDGEHGAWLAAQGRTFYQPAVRTGPIVDTNGAGDVFTGAMIHAVLSDWPPLQALRFAVTASGLKCTRLGNREALPTLDTIVL
ncbi:MAG: hypothetical protein KDA52_04875 [Planctomycetaceae bacterium]|nr:hypothetical protein [Planctomycetaceae bacterium]